MTWIKLIWYKIHLLLINWIAKDRIEALEDKMATLSEGLNVIGADYRRVKNDLRVTKSELGATKSSLGQLEQKHAQLKIEVKNVINIGIDLTVQRREGRYNDHSWMVVCLKNFKGQDHVNFYNLDDLDPRMVNDIVENYFHTSNKVQDYPMGMPRFDDDKIRRNKFF